MAIRKYLNWRGWLEGFYESWIKAVTTTFLALLTTNGADAAGITKGLGIGWRQALSVFVAISVVEVLRYLQTKPHPDEIEEQQTDKPQ